MRRVRSRESDAFERLALISSRLMSMMTDLRTLMSNQKDCSGDRLMLSIVRMNSWEHLWDDKSLIISNESRTVYKFSVHSSTKAMTTDYEYERSSSYREKWWYRDIIMMLSWHMFFFERTNHVLVIFFFLMIVVCWWCEDCLKYWTMRIERMQRSLIFRWIQKIRRFWSWVS